MSSMMKRFAGLCLLGALATPGCGDDDPEDNTFATCDNETRDDMFSPGMAKVGALNTVTVMLMTATPAPPLRGDNEWILHVVDGAGNNVDGAIIDVEPRMPDHGHGTSVKAVVTPAGMPGMYRVTPVNLFMAGLWETTVSVTAPGAAQPDSVVFKFCVN